MEEVVDEYITKGYDVKARGKTTVRVKKSNYGSLGQQIVVFLFFGWWTFLVANLLYALYKNSRGDEVLVKVNTHEGD